MAAVTQEQFKKQVQQAQEVFMHKKPSIQEMMKIIYDEKASDATALVYFFAIHEVLRVREDWPEEQRLEMHDKIFKGIELHHSRIGLGEEDDDDDEKMTDQEADDDEDEVLRSNTHHP